MDHWLENFDDYLYALQGAFDWDIMDQRSGSQSPLNYFPIWNQNYEFRKAPTTLLLPAYEFVIIYLTWCCVFSLAWHITISIGYKRQVE